MLQAYLRKGEQWRQIPISLKKKRSLVDTFECYFSAEALQYRNDCCIVKKILKYIQLSAMNIYNLIYFRKIIP